MSAIQAETDEFDSLSPYRRFRAVREERVDDQLFLVDQEGAAIHMLDPVATAVWTLLAEPVRVDEVAEAFASFFPDADTARIRDDVEDLFAELESYDLIQPVPATSA